MKTTTLALAISLFSLSANATLSSTPVKFVPGDLKPATSLCVIAAKEGVTAAKKAAVKLLGDNEYVEYSTICNGMPLKAFAKQYKIARNSK
ncbi:hypothetical protein [Thalassotalea aquiviva]|uniref:hypothetical protein n=1 Tax=Thalassotalea aquiviva TaxID=3242415 RepID=UPI00352A8F2F